MASSDDDMDFDEDLDLIIDDASSVSADNGGAPSLTEEIDEIDEIDEINEIDEIDVEGAFEGDAENSDDESAVLTKKKKLVSHSQSVTVDRNAESEDEGNDRETQKVSRRNSRRKGTEKTENDIKQEGNIEVNTNKHTYIHEHQKKPQ